LFDGIEMSRAFDEKLDQIASLGLVADPQNAVVPLRKALKDRSNYAVGKAAAIVGHLALRELIPDLVAAFNRFFADAVKSDPQCWAKNAIVKALKDLGHDDPDLYLRGMRHVQMEPVWGGRADSAGTLRGASALALPATSLPREEVLLALADLVADPLKIVRVDAIVAMAQLPGADVELVLRTKVLAGDSEVEVVGQCLTSLLDIAPERSLSFAARFLEGEVAEVAVEAAAALGSCPREEAVQVLVGCFERLRNAETRRAVLLALGASRLESARDFLLRIAAEGREADAAVAVGALHRGRFGEQVAERLRKIAGERGGVVARALG
jgi:HEAT repeat protein